MLKIFDLTFFLKQIDPFKYTRTTIVSDYSVVGTRNCSIRQRPRSKL